MKRKLAVLTAAIIGLSTTAFTTVLPQEFNAFTEIDASALTIIAEIKELSLEKDTIEIGETTHLNAKFDSGITDNAECGSSNSSVVKVVSGSVKDGWEIEGIGEGTAKILVHNGIYEKSVEITVTSTQSTEEPIPVPTEKTVFVEPGCYIDVVSQPNKTVYNIGNTLDLAGLKVDVMFASGGEKPISQINNDWRKVIDSENPLENENFIVDTSEFDSSKAGEYNIKVSLTDDAMSYKWWYCQSIDIPVTVVENDTIKGDVNADGNFTVADVVMLQKWLLAVDDVTLPNWKAADLCEDGKLDVFDLCMMKHELISNTDNKPVLTKAELRDIILSKEEYTWSDFEKYQSEDIGSGLYVLKYKVDFDGEDIEGNLYITGSDLEKKPEKIYIDVKRNDEEEKLDIYEFRQQLIDFIDSFNRQDMTMDDVLELSKKGKNLTWSDFENYQHGEDIGSGLAIYEFNIANYSDRFTLVVGYSDENSIQYARLKNLGYSIDITESSEDEILSFIAMCNPPA